MPVMTRKDRVKWLWSAKPRSQLMSANERSGSSNPLARFAHAQPMHLLSDTLACDTPKHSRQMRGMHACGASSTSKYKWTLTNQNE